MKTYPSILNSTGTSFREVPQAYIFDKIDGSNLRFEWSIKRGWHKFGTRNRLFDKTDPVFGEAIELFMNTMQQKIEYGFGEFGRNRIQNAIAFCEFVGPSSFAGQHVAGEPKMLYLFDIALNKKGLLGPKEFLHTFTHCQIPAFLGQYNWSRGFVNLVRQNAIEGITFEGVVGKSGEGHKLVMVKAKTQKWIDAVKARYNAEDAEKIINS